MASKGPRSKLDHESRAKRQKAREAPKEPKRPKTHWDHVLEEMIWLSKDFESERKWKLLQAKKVATRASKGMLDLATRGEKRVKEEEQKLRKVALNISKDVKKFWTKIEKLVIYKHQLELDEKKKKALDKQLEFLLGQTERYSSMLAENLVNSPGLSRPSNLLTNTKEQPVIHQNGDDEVDKQTTESDNVSKSNAPAADEDYDLQSGDEPEDDERTLEEDEALITKEEREEELAALQNEIDIPLEELLKRYASQEVSEEYCLDEDDNLPGAIKPEECNRKEEDIRCALEIEESNSSKKLSLVEKCQDGDDNIPGATKFEECNGIEDGIRFARDIQKRNSPEKPGRRCIETNGVLSPSNYHCSDVEKHIKRHSMKKLLHSEQLSLEFKDEPEDGDFVLSAGEENDTEDEKTLVEEEELAKAEPNNAVDEISFLQKESEVPIEELLARYKKCLENGEDVGDDSESSSTGSELSGSPEQGRSEHKQPGDESNRSPHLEDDEAECPGESGEDMQGEDIIADAAAAARSAQPTGNTFSTMQVRTKFPFLLKYPLREYQHIGLDWLVTMYDKRLNGILADEMGLGKTIMTIALLAHLACENGIWGPHLIVVPTSVMLNWETEFLKWCPAFKILTYFGSAKERRIKRQGWLKPNSFHVCITTYRLVIQDSKVFKRKKWKYLILDEAHLIKNWKSQRWQTLLNFNSKRRILLTGTPLQNDLMELWSLMHFLMPHVFQSHQEFKDWFSNPISGMVDGQEKVNKEVVDRLHNVLRPFLLRRLKRDVEKQLPMKHEHVIYCRLSRRQRNLYEDFIASSETQATLASANFFGMISVIMQLRKVCNHPDLFEGRPIVSSFDMVGMDVHLSSSVCSILTPGPFSNVDLSGLGLLFTHLDFSMTSWESEEIQAITTPSRLIEQSVNLVDLEENESRLRYKRETNSTNFFEAIQKALLDERLNEAKERAAAVAWWNSLRCKRKPMYPSGLRELVSVKHPVHDIHHKKFNPLSYQYSVKLADIVLSPVERFRKMADQVESFMFAIPAARAPPPSCWCSKSESFVFIPQAHKDKWFQVFSPLLTPFRPAIVRRQVYFPDRRLIQFDCGKLQELAVLLRRLKSEGHRALIFTQMTKMLDVLEAFINLYGYTYMRLDGSTPAEERQTLMQRFNTNPKIFLFILSTRSGGVGINLVGADTVIFYDSDWNPAMDQQAQDRCHRIGQTREVHIYRLISESTIEENILKKANQKRALDDLVIQSGSYNTEFFKKLDPMELFSDHRTVAQKDSQTEKSSLSGVDLEAALKNAEDEADYMALKKVEEEEAVENQEFTEEAVGKIEDDELIIEEEMKPNGLAEPASSNAKPDEGNAECVNHQVEEGALVLASNEDEVEVDMLADVKQMAAAAAAAGQAMVSFENHLRPIDRYAIRFLEIWDPIIDKTSVESHIQIEETEWELEHIEKLKDDMEAEVDDDEEPLVYESWDADFATEVYKQQVALAQQQLMEDLEREAREKEALEIANSDSVKNDISASKRKSKKKKTRKAKCKVLKKGGLGSKSISMKEESSIDLMSIDDELMDDEMITSSDALSPYTSSEKKRKYASEDEDEASSSKKFKKSKPSDRRHLFLDPKSSSKHHEQRDKISDNGAVDLESKQINKTKTREKLSISIIPQKRVFTIKPEKSKKKGNVWYKDFFPSPDLWSPKEDAVLCAVVHEYGPTWNLACEILYGTAAGGSYRGRYRQPVNCSERFRELIQKYILCANDATNNDKATGSGKAVLRVTEDNVRMLLGVASGIPDNEHLLQKHFFAVISAAWRDQSMSRVRKRTISSQTGFYSTQKVFGATIKHTHSAEEASERVEFTNLKHCGKLITAALKGACGSQVDNRLSFNQQEGFLPVKERLDVTLELPGKGHETPSFPPVISLSILGADPPPSLKNLGGVERHFKSAHALVESQFRVASGICAYSSCLESICSPMSNTWSPTQQLQYFGKQKLPVPDIIKPSKAKFRRPTKDHTDLHSVNASEVFQPLPIMPTTDHTIGFDNNYLLDMYGEFTSLGTSEAITAEYRPDVTSGLDLSTLSEFTDIG